MSETEERRERISAKIAASQERMKRDSTSLPATPRRDPLPDAYPPEDYRTLAAEYPWLSMAAGLGLGMLAGALLPKRAGGKLGRHALTAATIAAELALALGKRAGTSAAEKTAPVRGKGIELAARAIELAAKARK